MCASVLTEVEGEGNLVRCKWSCEDTKISLGNCLTPVYRPADPTCVYVCLPFTVALPHMQSHLSHSHVFSQSAGVSSLLWSSQKGEQTENTHMWRYVRPRTEARLLLIVHHFTSNWSPFADIVWVNSSPCCSNRIGVVLEPGYYHYMWFISAYTYSHRSVILAMVRGGTDWKLLPREGCC